ncbi:SseB protein N-terminal domain-containing protein [Sinosporangium album]|uniref:SseB protein N-terminal domain-containing protein n=1 Tax=Sinosporangium album TaxID=504805 RepID=A0A1G7YWM5_9ACTN|nr:SseB family protein [Sinosporangium album]SDH00777.1 SseB protein N-terminal domain-containing protein [Sinosporangium album]
MNASSPFEEALFKAHAGDDLTLCLALLREADFAFPIDVNAAHVAWPAFDGPDRTWILAFTSAEAMRTVTGLEHHRIVSLVELAAGWPDLAFGLAVNPGLPVSFHLESGTVARLAVPTLEQDHAAGHAVPTVQMLLRPRDIPTLLASESPRVSGYCHHAMDVEHVATPSLLTDALLRDEALTEQGSVNILRWPAAGPVLYRTPYGGPHGWAEEEEPFTGMGLAPNVNHVIREYKVDGVGLPYGSEIVELTADGEEILQARFEHRVGGRWHGYRARWRDGEHDVLPELREGRWWVRLGDGTAVPAEECEELRFVTAVCEWAGAPFQVVDERDGELLLEYTGGRVSVARDLGLERVDRGVHRRWTAEDEIRGLREHTVTVDFR